MARTPEIEAIAKRAAEHYNGANGFANAGKINRYVCEGLRAIGKPLQANYVPAERGCGFYFDVIDREPGVTPFLVQCPKCKGFAKSSFYRGPQNVTPTYEHFRPDTLDGLDGWELEHVEKGGLLLRKIGAKPQADPTPAGDNPAAKAIRLQDLADPTARQAIDAMLPQLLICLIERAGGTIEMPITELDTVPVGKRMLMKIDQETKAFHFVVTSRG